jgi:predicted permease
MITPLIARVRSLWRGLRRGPALQADMDEEFRLHQELRAADLARAGVAAAEARRRARLEFGSAEHFKEKGRRSRGLRRFDDLRVSWLDVKLGFRMLARYPGLTVVGGLAMAFAIWLGAATFELVTQVIRPSLPLPDGNRIVAIRNWDAAASRPERHLGHDFVAWRQELTSVRDLGAYRALERNLITGEGRGEPVEVAEISAAAFRLTRVPPLLGRALAEADERPGAPPVVVIGHDVWQRRFGGDPGVVGQTVRLASSQVTVVGVMPEGFEFPVAQSFWVPLRLNPLEFARRQGPPISVFGRLAPGATLDEAQAELTALGRRASIDFRDTHEHLRPQVMPYARSIVDATGWRSVGVMSVNLPLIMLLVLVCGNVALLMFARAATRESEIVVRTALGAGRARIIMQLFAEALVLGGVAAVVGLAAAGFGLRWVMGVIEAEFLEGGRLPFWFQDRLSATTLLYAALLTVFGAVIAGVGPALKVTRGVGARLKQATAGGGGLKFGGVWTAVIIAQVAVTVAFPAVAFFVRSDAAQIETVDVGFPAREYLSVRLEMDREPPPGAAADTSRAAFAARFRATYQELERRVAAEPNVVRIAFADRLPLMYHPHRLIAIDEGGAAPLHPGWPAGYRVSAASVAPDYFDAVDAPVLSGRGFRASDHAVDLGQPGDPDARPGVVVVNQSFVKLVLGGRNPIGRRIQYVELEEWPGPKPPEAERGPWYEIVGVVRDLGMAVGADAGNGSSIRSDADGTQPPRGDPKVAGVYHPVAPGGVYPAHMGVHVSGDPAAFAPRLRAIATAIDPTLRLYKVMPLSEVTESELKFLDFWFRLLLLVSAVALILSLAGIYAVMSFTVARRTREIGVRIALGANRRRVVTAVFRRPLLQVALGVAVGGGFVAVFVRAVTGSWASWEIAVVVAYAVAMMGVCLLACIVPTRRALSVQPTEALRAEG